MSVTKRLISGSAASWVQIAIGMATQIAIVPIYLNYWDVETYGVWLAIQALVGFLSMPDFGHQQYLGFEFLRIGNKNQKMLSRYLWSGVLIGLCISLFQISLIVILLFSGVLPFLLGETSKGGTDIVDAAGIVLIIQIIAYMIVISVSGLITRVLSPFGYYPRMAWWGVANAIVISVAPLGAVILGADLLTTGIVAALASVAYSVPLYVDLIGLLSREKIPFSRPSLALGYKNFVQSLALSGKFLLDNIRQQGTRLVLAPLAGAVGLAAFSTMRTGANVALQGMNTIASPLMPDLIRFLYQRDQDRTEASFGVIWIVVIALMAPGVIILQIIVEPLYVWWTDEKIAFNPFLFAVLSMGVLVYAVIQPALAVVTGNNLLKPQIWLSFLAAGIVIGGTSALVPRIGILGAGLALLVSEVSIAMGYIFFAKRWLHANGLRWPVKAFQTAIASICIAGLALSALLVFPQASWLVLFAALLLLAVDIKMFWNSLPALATTRAKQLISRLPGIRQIFG